jgi:error-prone DNA polymerase
VRVGLGYVVGLSEVDAEAVVRGREEGGAYRDLGDLAARSGVSRDGLEKLAWADACSGLPRGKSTPGRRSDLWALGVARGSARSGSGEQLALPLPVPDAPALAEQTRWERVTADYASTGMSLTEHPMALMRIELDPETLASAELAGTIDGSPVVVAGMTVARQRPATANGVVFLLLEDEWGMINVVVPPPVYARHRLLVRTAGFVSIAGKLERRDGVVNVVAVRVVELERPDLPRADVRRIEPPVDRETGRRIADLDAVLPAAHSFGRRAR